VNKPRIYTVYYVDFVDALQKAINAGQRIDKTEKQRWADYVRKNKIPEAAMSKRGESMCLGGRIESVIINDNGEWEGYYVYSKDDQFCVKFDVQGD
jgi:hypothetical protein